MLPSLFANVPMRHSQTVTIAFVSGMLPVNVATVPTGPTETFDDTKNGVMDEQLKFWDGWHIVVCFVVCVFLNASTHLA